ncbi:MAG: thioredoxin-disulfide reductase [Lachnospiraceae bacterium]|nr:thioredoxin-disulfide reductase [Lachnospiraceae bacterium]
MYDMIIIGSGPAGLAAAIYAQRARLKTLVIEREYMSGGQVVNTYEVDNYPGFPGIGGFELGMKFREHADKLGAEFMNAEVTEMELSGTIKKIVTDEGVYEAKTVILAMGAQHRELGVPGENELAGMGVSYCATCDGAFFTDHTVAVVGGGDVAVEDAIFLSRGCEKVYVIHRRDELRAAKSLQEHLFACKNVEFLWDTEVTKICGEDHIECIMLHNKKTGEKKTMDIDGLFVAVGTIPNSDLVKGKVELDDQGYVIAGEDCVTSTAGVFAAGDLRRKMMQQIITAAADGANAVNSAQKYLMTL